MTVDAARLRITLRYVDPMPVREVEVPLSMTFQGLHDTIQAAFLWHDCHLWEFNYAGKVYGIPFEDEFYETGVYSAKTARLTKLRDDDAPKEFTYVYDMGDNWEHRIKVLKLFEQPQGTRLPQFLKGKWCTPPEDIGGAPGYKHFLEILKNPNHEEYAETVEWLGGDFDVNNIDEEIIRIGIGRLANMRRIKK